MKLYLSVIGLAMTVISATNIVLGLGDWYYIIAAVVWCTLLQFVLDGLVAFTASKLPRGWFGVDNPLFNVNDKKMQLYKKLKVSSWKDKVWELGGLGGFSKKSLKEPLNADYLERFIIECNRGVFVHRVSYFIGFIALFTLPSPYKISIALPVASVNLFLNILPTIVLRFNTPTLKSLYKRLKRKEAVKAAKNETVI